MSASVSTVANSDLQLLKQFWRAGVSGNVFNAGCRLGINAQEKVDEKNET